MDDAVAEVFRSMLDQSCFAIEPRTGIQPDFCAAVTLSGTFHAQCLVEFPAASARSLTHAFLGSAQPQADDSMIGDAIGELCNMMAGGWKTRLGPSAWTCDLSVPSILRASSSPAPNPQLNIPQPNTTAIRRAYAFGDAPFSVILHVPEMV
jgi:chemotaxis protein CheX